MPRKPRILQEGGLYHVYNRSSHGTPLFDDSESGLQFVESLAQELKGDGHLVYAWVVMGNHYHVVLRSSPVSLARSFGRIQSAFGRYRNRLVGSRGPNWQSRYKAKLVDDKGYLMKLIAYVHLNPVKAGLVEDPADHRFSGHLEVLGRSEFHLIERKHVLSLYGDTERAALKSYRSSLTTNLAAGSDWMKSNPGRLPWWGRQVDRPVEPPHLPAWVGADGRPSREPRPRLTAEEFIQRACVALGLKLEELGATSRRRELTNLRFMVVSLGIERWGQKAGELAAVFGRRADYVSWWAKRGRELRLGDAGWEGRYDALDERLRFGDQQPR